MLLYPVLGGIQNATGSLPAPNDVTEHILLGPPSGDPNVPIARHGYVQHWDHTGGSQADNETMKVFCEGAVDGDQQSEWHFGFTGRASIWPQPLTPTTRRGHGIIGGRVFSGGDPHAYPTAALCPPVGQFVLQAESWAEGTMPLDYEFLLKDSGSRPYKDHTLFQLEQHFKRYNGNIYVRYLSRQMGPRAQWTPTFDTGDMQDNNWAMNRFSDALSLFFIGARTAANEVRISKLRVEHEPATGVVPDQRVSLRRP